MGSIPVPAGSIPVVSTDWDGADRWGAFKVRANYGRKSYTVAPGLYAVGSPGQNAPVLVSANYKLSFDHLRRELAGLDAWILVLDTKGINVWCAAGKGTFGTAELVNRIEAAGLDTIVDHKKVIVPQLGAPGVAAHVVKKATGFSVIYGPVLARDIPVFLRNGMKASPAMRRINFGIRDRAVLVGVEFFLGLKVIALTAAVLLLLAGIGTGGYSTARALHTGGPLGLLAFLGFISGAVITPVLLPWIPGKAFACKGLLVSLAVTLLMYRVPLFAGWSYLLCIAGLLIPGALSSYAAMNFTGASTYASLSGVLKEMKYSIPLQIAAGLAGVVLLVVNGFSA